MGTNYKFRGNFLNMPHNDFPLDCEGMDYMQARLDALEILGTALGDKVIVSGCEGDETLSAGWVWLRTKAFPEGELLRYEGGSKAAGLYIEEQKVDVEAQGKSYPSAWTGRWLAAGVGTESYKWEDFSRAETLQGLRQEIDRLQGEVEKNFQPEAIGSIKLWPSEIIPENWLLCDGSSLSISEYAELYSVIGTSYGGSGNLFSLPDLRGQFVVGYHPNYTDYNAPGKKGGHASMTLSEENLPVHKHQFNDYTVIPKYGSDITEGDVTINGVPMKAGSHSISGFKARSQMDSVNVNIIQRIVHDTESVGGSKSFDLRPPYISMPYIIKAK